MDQDIKYVIITPVRDEESYVEETVRSVASQTVLPTEWIIVNDGSSDRTGAILDQCATRLPWMQVIHRPNRGFRKSGGGVIEAFNEGYNALSRGDWEFVVKLDGDLTLPANYFEKCFEHFLEQPRLGIGGGVICHEVGGALKVEANPKFHVRGATKIYRRACWEAIGGLWSAPGWDTIDEAKANMLGWKSDSFGELRLRHHRVTGTADGLIRDRIKHGLACYISGYHPLFVAASCMYRIVQKPYVIGSFAMGYGFVKAYVNHVPRVDDTRLITYMRSQQLRRLCGLETIWK
jgi:glycosyltransferase involved in cell wall biosynthesis